jgi:hypothetical protein
MPSVGARPGLSRGDTTGMWTLNLPFPNEKAEVAQSFANLRDLLPSAVNEPDNQKFETLSKQYTREREKFFAPLSPEEKKCCDFQLWQEGIARYTQIRSAEAAAQYQPTAAYTALPDFESFSSYAGKARNETLDQLRRGSTPMEADRCLLLRRRRRPATRSDQPQLEE